MTVVCKHPSQLPTMASCMCYEYTVVDGLGFIFHPSQLGLGRLGITSSGLRYFMNITIYICATAFIWYLAQIHYLLCGGPISFRLLKQEVMSQYLVQTTLVANHTISFRLL